MVKPPEHFLGSTEWHFWVLLGHDFVFDSSGCYDDILNNLSKLLHSFHSTVLCIQDQLARFNSEASSQ